MAVPQRLPLPSLIGLLAALGSTGMLGGALYFQYVVGLAPCEMCHWQRWPHIASIVVGLLAFASFARPRVAATFAVLAVAALAVTSAIGAFHAGVELHWWQGPQTCTGTIPRGLSADELKKYLFGAKMVRCDDIVWSLWGISMAGWNAVLSGVLALALASGLAGSRR
jgi:disulfide bond formation protein DsbB